MVEIFRDTSPGCGDDFSARSGWPVTRMLSSSTCRLIVATIFIAILVIEAVIFIPAYHNRERELTESLRAHAVLVISTMLRARDGPATPALLEDLVGQDAAIAGIAMLDETGEVLVRAGSARERFLGAEAPGPQSTDAARSDMDFDVHLPSAELPGPHGFVVHIDGRQVQASLHAFAWNISGLVLLISLFVSAAALVVVGHVMVNPMLRLRDHLVRARAASWGDELKLEGPFPTSESADMAEALNELLAALARSHGDAISDREQRFSDFAQSASDWFWEMDENLRFSYFSERFTEVTGVPQDALLGKTRQETGIPDVDPEQWNYHLTALAERRPFRNFVHPRTLPSGEVVWVAINGRPVFDNQGRFRGYRGTGADITALRRAQEAMQKAKQEAERANKAKSQFLASMSHELRTPLNAVMGFAEAIEQELAGPVGTPAYLEYANHIHASGQHLLSLVNEILDLSKVEAGKVELLEQCFGLADVVSEAVRMLEAIAGAKQISIRQQLPVRPLQLVADSGKICQVLINLLSNAVKFTPDGGMVEIAAVRDKDGSLVLSVTDTGVGIAAADIETALSPFGQVRSGLPQSQPGTGLGLPLCKGYAELHGGSLEIDSQPGKGTCVRLRLPASRLVEGAIVDAAE